MLKKLGRIFIAFALIMSSLLVIAPAVGAEEETEGTSEETSSPAIWLQISPVSNKVVLKPGEQLEYNFTVSNIGSEDFGYHVYASPYSVTDEEYNVSFSNETNRTQISRWIEFEDSNGNWTDEVHYSIDSGEKQTIKYRVSVPEDVPAGGQYATIFAESDEVEGDIESSGIKTVSRVGLIVYGRTDGDTLDEAVITDYNVPGFMISGPISANARIENNGNTDFEVMYDFTISSLFGKQLYTKSGSYNVLPDTARKIDTEWEETPVMGVYKVNYKVAALNGSVVEDHTKIVIIAPVFVIIIAIILLTFIVFWIIIMVRKRKERKSRLLV